MTELIEELNNLKIIEEKDDSKIIEEKDDLIKNKGTGAGGKNTNKNGKSFENITDIETKLIENKYEKMKMDKSKYGYYLYKNIDNNKIIYVSQNGLKLYIKQKFDIELFRNPDEAYIIEKNGKYIIKILEKKAQNVEGSIETKLWSGPALKREYEIIMGNNYVIEYAFCVSKFLQEKLISNDKKYEVLKQILDESNINIFYGEDSDYFDKIYEWINNF